ncbi:MAG: hypothetical protein Ct9H300mP1_29920 [Planctomycetaceae bacterium]|nr:MAG: hypothetical protein Ct9H300mP1_29920 [Planctomycetaceae bacterium]
MEPATGRSRPGRVQPDSSPSQVLRLSDLLQLAQYDREVHATRFEILLLATRLLTALEIKSSFPRGPGV